MSRSNMRLCSAYCLLSFSLFLPKSSVAQAVATKWTQVGHGIIDTGIGETEDDSKHHQCGRTVQAAWAADPKQLGQKVLWMGTARGGLWKSKVNSSGEITSWVPLTDNFAGPHEMGSFLIHPLDSAQILIGPGGMSSGSGNGKIYRTATQGGSWVAHTLPINSGETTPKRVNRIVSDRSDSTGNTALACTDHGIYRSTDFGLTWARVFKGVVTGTHDEVTDIVQDTADGARWFAAAIVSKVILRSTGSGQAGTWAIFAGVSPISGSVGRVSLAACDANENVLYALVIKDKAAADKDGALNGVWRSLDRGKNWANIYDNNSAINALNQGLHTCGIGCDPTNPDHLIFGLQSPIETFHATTHTRFDTTWPDPFDGGHHDYNFILFRKGHSDVIIENDGGYYTYKPSDGSIDDSGNLKGINCQWLSRDQGCFASSRSRPEEFAAGLQDNGIVRGNATVGTLELMAGGDGGQVSIMPTMANVMAASSTVFIGGANRSLSLDYGQDWIGVQGDLDDDNFSSMLIDPTPGLSSPKLFTYSQLFGLSYIRYRNYFDTISSWSFVNAPLAGALTHLDHTTDSSLHQLLATMDGDQRLWIYSGARSGLASLLPHDKTPPLGTLQGTADAHANADRSKIQKNTIYYTTAAARPSKAFISVNAGTAWIDVTGDLPNVGNLNKLVGNPTNLYQLFLATDKGVYRTDNLGVHWYKWSTGLRTNEEVQDIVINSDGLTVPTIYVATKGRGFWQRAVQ